MERIFQNLMIDAWRTRRVEVSVEELPLASMTPSAEDQVLRKECLHSMRASLAQLPPELSQTVALRYLEEQEESVASVALGVAPPTIRTRIHRALARMRSTLCELRAFLPFHVGQNFQLSVYASFTPMIPVLLATTLFIGRAPSAKPDALLSPDPFREPTTPRLIVQHQPVFEDQSSDLPAALPIRPLLSRGVLAQAHSDRPKAPSTVVYDFENDDVVGDLERPDGVDIVGPPPKANQSSLIEIPQNFIPAFQKMTENLL
jgi:hypothetical protein